MTTLTDVERVLRTPARLDSAMAKCRLGDALPLIPERLRERVLESFGNSPDAEVFVEVVREGGRILFWVCCYGVRAEWVNEFPAFRRWTWTHDDGNYGTSVSMIWEADDE